ncbi:uncharacterized protein LOC106874216 [Octopus bimaculoides]|uniref:uncharacterized protein LOC106874216 n=1 Tax=Octopus bimaculoides TaxID=37653 RepID=UPI00071D840E|nr:uncharacterized protein LOC106874216 [Octopus bimaculoides]|eukprot:XP_014777360.1 PREDICTED: uncharacterized protein LOC106874216 [Octopus bimaculoides]
MALITSTTLQTTYKMAATCTTTPVTIVKATTVVQTALLVKSHQRHLVVTSQKDTTPALLHLNEEKACSPRSVRGLRSVVNQGSAARQGNTVVPSLQANSQRGANPQVHTNTGTIQNADQYHVHPINTARRVVNYD